MLPLGFAVFALFGVCLVLLGANQESLANDLGLDLTQLGLLGSALACGIGIGVVGAGPLVDRLPRRPLFVAAALLAAAGLGWVGPDIGFARALVQVGLVGIAIGAHETLVNTCISQLHGESAAKPLIVAHAGATLAATLAPLAIAASTRDLAWYEVFRFAALGQLLLAGVCLFLSYPPPLHGSHAGERAGIPLRALLPFLVVSFAYVGVETTLSLYVVPYADAVGAGEARGLRAMSFFWGGLLFGRLALLAVQRRIDARFLLGAGIAGGASIALGIGAGVLPLEATYACVGVSMGFVFPVLIALASVVAPHAQGTATGLAAGAGAAGGLFIPPLHGGIGDLFGISVTLTALVGWCGVMALAALAAMRQGSR